MKNIVYIVGILLLLASCYDDKGNYDYTEMNEVAVELPESFGLRLSDTTLVIRPVISQSLRKRYDHLKFVWRHSTVNFSSLMNGDTLSMADTVALHIDPEDENLKYSHFLRLLVYDEENDITYPYQTKVQISKPYEGAWMVLHKQAGETRLGAVEYIGDGVQVSPDVYYPTTGKKLHGEPLLLSCHNFVTAHYLYNGGSYSASNTFLLVTDDPKEAGVYCQWKKFEKLDSLSRMVAPNYRDVIDYKHISLLEGNQGYTICLSNGVLYQGNSGLKLYKAPISADVTGEVFLSGAIACSATGVFYDKIGRRFLWYYGRGNESGASTKPDVFNEAVENKTAIGYLPSRSSNVQYGVVNLNKLPDGQEVLYLGDGYRYGTMYNMVKCYAFAKGANNKSYVYEFQSRGLSTTSDKAFSGYYEINTPAGVDENTCFASNISYNGVMFYAAGKTVYRLDYTQQGGIATVIYQHDEGTATKMKFAKYEDSNVVYPENIYNVYQQLGVVFEKGDGTSDLVVLDLATSGKPVEVQKYSGQFGKIKDIVFL